MGSMSFGNVADFRFVVAGPRVHEGRCTTRGQSATLLTGLVMRSYPGGQHGHARQFVSRIQIGRGSVRDNQAHPTARPKWWQMS